MPNNPQAAHAGSPRPQPGTLARSQDPVNLLKQNLFFLLLFSPEDIFPFLERVEEKRERRRDTWM